MEFRGYVYVTLKPTVNDPQGTAIMGGLRALGFAGVQDVRSGKFLVLRLEAPDQAKAEARLEDMCKKLLANPVIEAYRFEVRRKAARRSPIAAKG